MWQAPNIRKFLNRHRSDGSGGLKNGIDEPTYVSFWVDFKTNDNIVEGDFNTMPHGLLTQPNGENYSAEEYLRNIGYPRKAENIRNFRILLKKIIAEAPWTITSISGLDTIYKPDVTTGWNNRGKEAKITINMTDALDMRASSLMELYILGTLDEKYTRDLLPDIMKYFKMQIWISEFRMFHEPKVKSATIDPLETETKNLNPISYIEDQAPSSILPKTRIGRETNSFLNAINNASEGTKESDSYFLRKLEKELSLWRFDLEQCEIDITSIKPSWTDDITNTQIGERVTLTFDIKVGNVNYAGYFPVIYTLLENAVNNNNFNSIKINNTDDSNKGGTDIESYDDILSASRGYKKEDFNKVYKQKSKDQHLSDLNVRSSLLQDKLYRIGENMLEDGRELAIGLAEDYALTNANRLLLGNVYGLSTSQLINRISNNPASLTLAAQDLLGRTTDPATGRSILGNIYNETNDPSLELNPDTPLNIYNENDSVKDSEFNNTATEESNRVSNIYNENSSVKDSQFNNTATDDSNIVSRGILGPRS